MGAQDHSNSGFYVKAYVRKKRRVMHYCRYSGEAKTGYWDGTVAVAARPHLGDHTPSLDVPDLNQRLTDRHHSITTVQLHSHHILLHFSSIRWDISIIVFSVQL